MPASDRVSAELHRSGVPSGARVQISVLPKSRGTPAIDPLIVEDDASRADPSEALIQLLEAAEYRYQLNGVGSASAVTSDRPEIFEADDHSGHSGRLRPGMYTGTLQTEFFADGTSIGRFAVEVRSRKLEYRHHYQWMLRDIAEAATELIMERFGPTQQRFAPDPKRDSRTAYQRFAFLQSLLGSETFAAAIARILQRPYVQWIEIQEVRPTGRGLNSGSSMLRQLNRPGPRVLLRPFQAGGIHSVPETVETGRPEESLDNLPNRFVKFVLRHWHDQVTDIQTTLTQTTLTSQSTSAPVERGLREITAVLDRLHELLSQGIFREVGDLAFVPLDNPTLLSREGYREILDSYLTFDLAAKLSWQGGDDVYGAGQRDVATLYEFWVFIKLAQVVSKFCDTTLDLERLVESSASGLNLNLIRGKAQRLSGVVSRFGRRLELSLWFNRSFGDGDESGSSWTRELRPDFSIQFRYLDSDRHPAPYVWVHFDAKYRIDRLRDFLAGDDPDSDTGPNATARTQANRDDVLKMHAYRDAIRRSGGAYVIYPGDETKCFQEYQEILPGLGAFGLRPLASGDADGSANIARFLDDVISHTATQVSQHERNRYWEQRAYAGTPSEGHTKEFAAFLSRPPADTQVLLGYVKGAGHLSWIRAQRRYNLRADKSRRGSVALDSSELGSELVLLYGRGVGSPELWRIRGNPEIATRSQLLESGYPDPGGEHYFCLPIEPIDSPGWSHHLTGARIHDLRMAKAPRASVGEPVVVTWLALMALNPSGTERSHDR